MIYKNVSNIVKTFYGVTFQPGDEHDVPGYINCPGFVVMPTSTSTEGAKKSATSTKSTNTSTKKEVNTNGSDSNK